MDIFSQIFQNLFGPMMGQQPQQPSAPDAAINIVTQGPDQGQEWLAKAFPSETPEWAPWHPDYEYTPAAEREARWQARFKQMQAPQGVDTGQTYNAPYAPSEVPGTTVGQPGEGAAYPQAEPAPADRPALMADYTFTQGQADTSVPVNGSQQPAVAVPAPTLAQRPGVAVPAPQAAQRPTLAIPDATNQMAPAAAPTAPVRPISLVEAAGLKPRPEPPPGRMNLGILMEDGKLSSDVLDNTGPRIPKIGEVKVDRGIVSVAGLTIENGVVPTALYMSPGRFRPETAIKRIIVHGDVSTNVDNLVRYGRQKDRVRNFDPGYHFYVGQDGRVVQGAPVTQQTWHTGSSKGVDNNRDSIGIVFMGADNGRAATPQQIAAGKALIAALGTKYQIDPKTVIGHGELQPWRRHKMEGGGIPELVRKEGYTQYAPMRQPPMPATANPFFETPGMYE